MKNEKKKRKSAIEQFLSHFVWWPCLFFLFTPASLIWLHSVPQHNSETWPVFGFPHTRFWSLRSLIFTIRRPWPFSELSIETNGLLTGLRLILWDILMRFNIIWRLPSLVRKWESRGKKCTLIFVCILLLNISECLGMSQPVRSMYCH